MPKTLKREFDILVRSLNFTQGACEEEARRLPHDFMRASVLKIGAMTKTRAAAMGAELTYGRIDLQIREELRDAGEKATEAQVSTRVKSHREYVVVHKALDKAQIVEKTIDLLLDALRIKKSTIGDVARLSASELAMERFAEREEAMGKLKSKASKLSALNRV